MDEGQFDMTTSGVAKHMGVTYRTVAGWTQRRALPLPHRLLIGEGSVASRRRFNLDLVRRWHAALLEQLRELAKAGDKVAQRQLLSRERERAKRGKAAPRKSPYYVNLDDWDSKSLE